MKHPLQTNNQISLCDGQGFFITITSMVINTALLGYKVGMGNIDKQQDLEKLMIRVISIVYKPIDISVFRLKSADETIKLVLIG